MKKTLILLFTIISITSAAQDLSKGIDSIRRQLNKDMASFDSVSKTSDSLIKVYSKRRDSAEMARYAEQNTNNIVSFMKERDDKARKGAWTRIGFGIAMLVILIIGLLRKRKKKITE